MMQKVNTILIVLVIILGIACWSFYNMNKTQTNSIKYLHEKTKRNLKDIDSLNLALEINERAKKDLIIHRDRLLNNNKILDEKIKNATITIKNIKGKYHLVVNDSLSKLLIKKYEEDSIRSITHN